MAEVERVPFADGGADGTAQTPTVDYEAKARESGWSPQESFKGAPEKWIDAKSWVERGESFIPFLQASNRGLKDEVGTLRAQLEETRRLQQATMKAIGELQTDVGAQTVVATEAQLEELTDEIAKAREDGDTKLEFKLMDQRADLKRKLDASKEKPAVVDGSRGTPSTVDVTADPRFQKFLSDNPWFREDPVMAGAAVAAMGQLNASDEGRAMTPEQRFERVARDVKKRFGMADNPRRRTDNRVEGGRMEGSTGGGGGEKTYDSLPSDAKTQCDMFSKRFVGKVDGQGKVKYPDLAAYRAKYAADYFAEDWGTKIQQQ